MKFLADGCQAGPQTGPKPNGRPVAPRWGPRRMEFPGVYGKRVRGFEDGRGLLKGSVWPRLLMWRACGPAVVGHHGLEGSRAYGVGGATAGAVGDQVRGSTVRTARVFV